MITLRDVNTSGQRCAVFRPGPLAPSLGVGTQGATFLTSRRVDQGLNADPGKKRVPINPLGQRLGYRLAVYTKGESGELRAEHGMNGRRGGYEGVRRRR